MCIQRFQESSDRADSNPSERQPQWHRPCSTRKPRSGQGRPRPWRSKEHGFSTLGATLLFLIFSMGAGTIGIFKQVSHRIEEQISLDQTTGKIVLQLRASVITMEESKNRLKIGKAAMVSACMTVLGCPSATSAYELLEKVEAAIQQVARSNWLAQKPIWFASSPKSAISESFPDLDATLRTQKAEVRINNSNLNSTARLWVGRKGLMTNEWNVAWVE